MRGLKGEKVKLQVVDKRAEEGRRGEEGNGRFGTDGWSGSRTS
jgi:hypothetical protein